MKYLNSLWSPDWASRPVQAHFSAIFPLIGEISAVISGIANHGRDFSTHIFYCDDWRRTDVDEPTPTNSTEPRGAGGASSHAPQGGIGHTGQGRVPARRGDELFRQGRRLLHDLIRQG